MKNPVIEEHAAIVLREVNLYGHNACQPSCPPLHWIHTTTLTPIIGLMEEA
ncbi:hypothetical protein [Thiothrix lacustris]|uniref:hypothetical protein n=1 Tax=Thiothrix lacustris TaxID=525917 RepID=UPI000A6840BB|nr:hypothetical protein [Thiothrix lacustris]